MLHRFYHLQQHCLLFLFYPIPSTVPCNLRILDTSSSVKLVALQSKNRAVTINSHMCIDIQSEHIYVILFCIIQSISYMFRPLLGHHQVALSLQCNCIIQSAYLMGEEISFTMVRYMNPINRMVPIFVTCMLYALFCSYCLTPVLTPGRCVPEG